MSEEAPPVEEPKEPESPTVSKLKEMRRVAAKQ